MNIVDMDGLFRKFAKNYITENSAKNEGRDGDEVLEEIYEAFENTRFFELDGKTPLDFYGSGEDYAELIKAHAEAAEELSDYLLEGAVRFGKEEDLVALLTADGEESVVLAAIDILEKKNCKKAFNRYIDLFFDKNTDECVTEKLVEVLSEHASEVADGILARLGGDGERDDDAAYILSHSAARRDGIADLLRRGLLMGDRISEYCANVINYGDESLLGVLEELIDTVDDYVSFKELNLAIEALGGERRPERDFACDRDYIKIKESSKKEGEGGDGDKN